MRRSWPITLLLSLTSTLSGSNSQALTRTSSQGACSSSTAERSSGWSSEAWKTKPLASARSALICALSPNVALSLDWSASSGATLCRQALSCCGRNANFRLRLQEQSRGLQRRRACFVRYMRVQECRVKTQPRLKQ